MCIRDRDKLRQQRDNYRESMARCKGVIENLSPQLEGAVYADLEQMQREKDELLQRIREREEEYSQLKFRRRSNEEAYHKLTSLWHGCEKRCV